MERGQSKGREENFISEATKAINDDGTYKNIEIISYKHRVLFY